MIQKSIDKRFALSFVRYYNGVIAENIYIKSHHSRNCLYRQSFSSSTNDDSKRRLAYVFSSLDSGLIAYDRGWAWQQALLHRRLEYQRLATDGETIADDSYDAHDHILLLEHDPVYTLGRGAEEENLTFLDKEPDGGVSVRKRLSRKTRGSESARLSIDKAQRPCLQEPIETQVQRLHRKYFLLFFHLPHCFKHVHVVKRFSFFHTKLCRELFSCYSSKWGQYLQS